MDKDATQVIPVQPVPTSDGDPIYQRMATVRKTLIDAGLTTVTIVYMDGISPLPKTLVAVVTPDTQNKVLSILEDENLV